MTRPLLYGPSPSATRVEAHSSLWRHIRVWLSLGTVAGLAVVYLAPQADRVFTPATSTLLRQAAAQAASLGQILRPFVHLLTVLTLLVWVGSWWAYRQRRRVTEQIARLLRLYPQQLRTRVILGASAPLRAKVKLPPGVVIKDTTWTELRTEIRESWNYAYTLRRDPRWDRLILIRPWRRGAHRTDTATARPYASQAHERLDAVRESLPFQVRSIDSGEVDPQLGQPSYLDVRFESTLKAASEQWQEKVGHALAGITGRAPEGYEWTPEWYPDEDRVRLVLTEEPPQPRELERFTPHPVIADYPATLGTNRMVLPYATGSLSPYLWWDIDPSSNAPHMLTTGPTGGGKTTAVAAVIAEGARRGLPFVLFDPKRFELSQFAYHPGVLGVATDTESILIGIENLWAEKEKRSQFRLKRPWWGNRDMPLFGIVIDEFLLLSFLLQQAMKRDKEVKAADPLSKLNLMVTEIRAVGGRFDFLLQRPDASAWGDGNARSNLGTRLALSRNDKDGDQMMWGQPDVTSQLDQSIPGRAIGTSATGDPEECQVWYTPNLNPHPWVRRGLSADDQRLVEALAPPEEALGGMWLPNDVWKPLGPQFSLEPPAQGEAEALPAAQAATSAPRSVPTGEVDYGDLDTACRADALTPQMRVAVELDGALVPATCLDCAPDGERVSLDIQPDGQSTRESLIADRDEMIALLAEPTLA